MRSGNMIAQGAGGLAALGGQEFNVLYADPPWSYDRGVSQGLKGCADEQYRTMSERELCQLEGGLRGVAGSNSVLFLWTTGPKWEESLRVGRAWGFDYKTVFLVWVKTTKADPARERTTALGWWSRPCAEFLLVFARGKQAGFIQRGARPSQLLATPWLSHSAKPEEARLAIESMLGDGARCLELFARSPPSEGAKFPWWQWGLDTVGAERKNALAFRALEGTLKKKQRKA